LHHAGGIGYEEGMPVVVKQFIQASFRSSWRSIRSGWRRFLRAGAWRAGGKTPSHLAAGNSHGRRRGAGLFVSRPVDFSRVGITVSDFQIAGGLILFILAARDLILATPENEKISDDFGVVPLGMPLIAGRP